MTEEIWRPVPGFEKCYMISSHARIKSIMRKNTDRHKIIKGVINQGYRRVGCHSSSGYKNFLVHRKLAEAFIPLIEGKNQVNHIDGNKLNNDLSNLEWVTGSENQLHASRTGLRKSSHKQRLSASIQGKLMGKPVYQITIEGTIINRFPSAREAGIQTNCSGHKINLVCVGQRKTHNGYIWKRVCEIIPK